MIDDQTILACLNGAFGLRADRLAFLPLGGDLGTAVYRAEEQGGTADTSSNGKWKCSA